MSLSVSDPIVFGGLEGDSGEYCLAPCEASEMLERLQRFRPHGAPRILKAGLDPQHLAEAGWGVIWTSDADDEVRDALDRLIELRRAQAGSFFQPLHYYSGETIFDFLERYDVGPDSVDPRKVPYYLLIVGSPAALPFDVQVELATSRAVGRIAFECTAGYADYADRLVDYELRKEDPDRLGMSFFGVENPDDRLTRMAVEDFVTPLEQMAMARCGPWRVESVTRANATKARIADLLGSHHPPSLMLTAGHAVRFHLGSPRQATHQGALVCADWPGPERWKGRGRMLDEHLFAASDVPTGADLSGLVAVLFACYSAGTPLLDAYADIDPVPLATAPFVSPLPRALLRRGALGVIGHVDLAFAHSFLWYRAGTQLETFDSLLYEVREGAPLGFAMRHLNQRHAQLAVHIAGVVRRASQQGEADRIRAFKLWAAYVDARNYILLGDPAARIQVGREERIDG